MYTSIGTLRFQYREGSYLQIQRPTKPVYTKSYIKYQLTHMRGRNNDFQLKSAAYFVVRMYPAEGRRRKEAIVVSAFS